MEVFGLKCLLQSVTFVLIDRQHSLDWFMASMSWNLWSSQRYTQREQSARLSMQLRSCLSSEFLTFCKAYSTAHLLLAGAYQLLRAPKFSQFVLCVAKTNICKHQPKLFRLQQNRLKVADLSIHKQGLGKRKVSEHRLHLRQVFRRLVTIPIRKSRL